MTWVLSCLHQISWKLLWWTKMSRVLITEAEEEATQLWDTGWVSRRWIPDWTRAYKSKTALIPITCLKLIRRGRESLGWVCQNSKDTKSETTLWITRAIKMSMKIIILTWDIKYLPGRASLKEDLVQKNNPIPVVSKWQTLCPLKILRTTYPPSRGHFSNSLQIHQTICHLLMRFNPKTSKS